MEKIKRHGVVSLFLSASSHTAPSDVESSQRLACGCNDFIYLFVCLFVCCVTIYLFYLSSGSVQFCGEKQSFGAI